jgi:hypothetical protein
VVCAFVQAQDAGGTIDLTPGWTYGPTEETPVVINENFQDWEKKHDKSDGETANARAGAYFDWSEEITYTGGSKAGQTLSLALFQCATDPAGISQYAFETLNGTTGRPVNPLVGAGFVEVSRPSSNSTKETENETPGSLTVPTIPGAMVVQYSYSSLGGFSRGIKLQQSFDNGETWEDVRNPIGILANGSSSGTSGYRESGGGLQVEDYVGDADNIEKGVSLRFTLIDGWTDETHTATNSGKWQDLRLHDLKIYAVDVETGLNTPQADAFRVIPLHDYIATGEPANIQIYSLNGSLVKQQNATTRLYTTDLVKGAYIIKASSPKGSVVKKYILR